MSATIFSFDDFYSFVEREIARISRYDIQSKEKVSIIFLYVPNSIAEEAITVLKNNLRKSDALFEKNGFIFLLLSNTGRMGSLHIDEIMKEFFDEKIECVISSYPEDGENLGELLEILKKVAKDEHNIDIDKYLQK